MGLVYTKRSRRGMMIANIICCCKRFASPKVRHRTCPIAPHSCMETIHELILTYCSCLSHCHRRPLIECTHPRKVARRRWIDLCKRRTVLWGRASLSYRRHQRPRPRRHQRRSPPTQFLRGVSLTPYAHRSANCGWQ